MKNQQGFTIVELLITMIIGTLLLFSAYQLYTYVINDSAEARMRASASSLAYQVMREKSALATTPCTTVTPAPPVVPTEASLPANTAITVALTCPTGSPSDITEINVTITYGANPVKTVTHGTYVRK